MYDTNFYNIKFGTKYACFGKSNVIRLRDLSGSTQTHVNAAPKYKSAQYKYDRGFMMSLFNRSNISPPDQLRSLEQIFVEDLQNPVTFEGYSEDELVSRAHCKYYR